MQMAFVTDRATIHPRLTASIITVAVFQIVVSVLTLTLFGSGVGDIYSGDIPPADKATVWALLGTALLEMGVAIGLLLLKNWARRMSLCMATVSVCACVIAAILHRRQPGFDFTPGIRIPMHTLSRQGRRVKSPTYNTGTAFTKHFRYV
jgi:hypothetical protein